MRIYADHLNDGILKLEFVLPCNRRAAASRIAEMMGLSDVQIVHAQPLTGLHTAYIIQAVCPHEIDESQLPDEPDPQWMDQGRCEELGASFPRKIRIVAAALHPDTHTMGLDAIVTSKGWEGHAGLEAYSCFDVLNMGEQVPIAELLEQETDVILVSQTVSQQGAYKFALKKLAESANTTVLIAGGMDPSVADYAKSVGFDAGFGKGTLPEHVATTIIRLMLERRIDLVHEQAEKTAA